MVAAGRAVCECRDPRRWRGRRLRAFGERGRRGDQRRAAFPDRSRDHRSVVGEHPGLGDTDADAGVLVVCPAGNRRDRSRALAPALALERVALPQGRCAPNAGPGRGDAGDQHVHPPGCAIDRGIPLGADARRRASPQPGQVDGGHSGIRRGLAAGGGLVLAARRHLSRHLRPVVCVWPALEDSTRRTARVLQHRERLATGRRPTGDSGTRPGCSSARPSHLRRCC